MNRLLVIYDDSMKPNKEVGTITGDKSYGDTIFKRIPLHSRIEAEIRNNKKVFEVLTYTDASDKEQILKICTGLEENISIIHLYSNYGLLSTKDFAVLLEKAEYINGNYSAVCDGKTAMAIIDGTSTYAEVFESLVNRSFEAEPIETNAFMDLSKPNNFLTFITSGFDARFFNALLGDEYTVTKRSTKIAKIKSEYNFYYLLPDHMKMWFVMPFDYKENSEAASYTMERFHMTDIAIRFVHGAVSVSELKDILEKLFYFISIRGKKAVESDKAKEIAKSLYIEKLMERMSELKKLKQYDQFNQLLAMGTKYNNLDEVVARYMSLYERVKRKDKEYGSLVIGHGDLCFSNILYNREAGILKLIDPKGALVEHELYTDPYYDLAKLSHSICGCYDFFNSGLYDISMDRDMKITLTIDADAEKYKELFKEYLIKNGYRYDLVRLYEASLFLSMLPYHMDQPGKVFGFILNAITILDEVEQCIME